MTYIYSPNMLQYLDMLLKHGNYTKAAKDLYISQPYLTQTIKKVEQELGIDIINRHSSPLQLTEAGKLYYQYLRSLETEQDEFRKKLSTYAPQKQTIIRIGILSSLGTYLLPLFLPTFMQKHPQIRIQLVETVPEQSEEKILAKELDFFIGQNPETISPNLTIHSRGPHGYYAVIPKSSKLYKKNKVLLNPDTLSVKQLLQEPLILTARGSAIRRQIDYLLQKHKIQPMILVESSNIFTVLELAKKNLGLTFIPESVQVSKLEGPYNLYPMPLELLSLDYFIAFSAEKTMVPAEKEFINYFLQQLETVLAPSHN
ncbi:LysR family transcriptional regulator [Erwinia sp. CPCC 100877]|nr:LysR family transcriptional regulator [Erwinia sp. CPCC 100877]